MVEWLEELFFDFCPVLLLTRLLIFLI